MSLSKIFISGKVITAPEKRYTQSDMAMVSFALEVQQTPEPMVVRVLKFGQSAEQVANEIKQFDMVVVEGRPQISKFQDEDGKEKRVIEINANTVEKMGVSDVSSFDNSSVSNPVSNNSEEGIVQFANNENVENLIDEEEIPF